MSFKEAAKKEMDVIVHGQTARFRLVKYAVLLLFAFLLFLWKGWQTTIIIFAILAVVSIAGHFFFRWKTRGWTQTWGLYKVKKQIYVDPRHEEHAFDLPFWRDNEKLWTLDVPVEEMKVDELIWMLDIPFWEDEQGNIVITPREVMDHPNEFPYHRDKLKDCDTSFPIDIMKNKMGNWATLDGLHRLVRLVMEGKTSVRVRKIPPEIIHTTARS